MHELSAAIAMDALEPADVPYYAAPNRRAAHGLDDLIKLGKFLIFGGIMLDEFV